MPEVRCPIHGDVMVLRTARTGPNAGKQFYGCPRFPRCKEVIPLELVTPDSPDDNGEPKKDKQLLTKTRFPRTLVARARFQDYQSRFFESAAVPEDVLQRICSGDIDAGTLRALSQWRVDFPIRESESALDENERRIVSVFEKLLTRGRFTLPSPRLENAFEKMFLKGSKPEPSLPLIESLPFRSYQKSQRYSWLDSNEETIFYEDILPKLLGEKYERFVLPQVEISSLLPPNSNVVSGHQRVDFAIFHPSFEEKTIVEIDGEQHKRHVDSDKQRDRALQESGYTVIRIEASEIQKGSGDQLSILQSHLSMIEQRGDQDLFSSYDAFIAFLDSIKVAHQIQLVLLHAIESGFLDVTDTGSWHIVTDLDELGIASKEQCVAILSESVADFMELLARLGRLYSIRLGTREPNCKLLSDNGTGKRGNAIFICFSGRSTSGTPTFHVKDIYFPFHIANSSFPATPAVGGLEEPQEEDLEYFLRYLFRKPRFWEGQFDGITRALRGKDSLLLLPTGAGKSLVYQLASLLLPGRTVVVDPIISLMEDQIDNLAMLGVDRCIAITSQIADVQDRERAIQLFGQGEYLFAYIAPERFQTTEFRESLRALTVHTPVGLIVVDEAHCISEWGHDFRTAYLNIGRTSRAYCESNGYVPPLIALTGTASRSVLKDVQRELQIDDFDAIITPKTFDRAELRFRVINSTSQEKATKLKGYLGQMLPSLFNVTRSTLYQTRGDATYSGLVFCPWINGEFGVVQVADEIRKDLAIATAYYSGSTPKHLNRDEYLQTKRYAANRFKRNEIPLLICTKAFGMGIDKPNIRYTIHFGIPPSIESFYQEAGRAGRNRKNAYCCMIVSNDDPERSSRLLNPNTKVEEIDEIIRNTLWEDNDDLTRVLYFHVNAFRGVERERHDIEDVLGRLGDVSKKGTKTLAMTHDERNIEEKALHRLVLIGVVSDYTVDYSRNEFAVKLSGATKEEIVEKYGGYVASYLYSRRQNEVEKATQFLNLPTLEFIKGMVRLLLHFIYEVIELGRRRALNEMLLACTASATDEGIRERILRYLEATEYSETLEQLISDENVGIKKCQDLFGSVCSPNEAAELRGQVSRYLESYPDHPSLLMLRFLSETYSRDKNDEVAKQNFIASISSARENYGLSDSIVVQFATWALSSIEKRDIELAEDLTKELGQCYPGRHSARMLVEQLPVTLSAIPAWVLLRQLQERCDLLVPKKGG